MSTQTPFYEDLSPTAYVEYLDMIPIGEYKWASKINAYFFI
jgi:hypothetical protein